MLFCLGADAIVGGLKGLEQLGELGVDFGGKEGHDRDGSRAAAPCNLCLVGATAISRSGVSAGSRREADCRKLRRSTT